MKRNLFPAGWDEARTRRVLQYYERQTDAAAVAEDEAAFRRPGQTVIVVPSRLVPEITRLIQGRPAGPQTDSQRPHKALQPRAQKPRRVVSPR